MDKEKAHNELENARLPNWVASQALHHVAIPRQVHLGKVAVIQSHFNTLHDKEEDLLSVRQVRGAEYHWRPEQLHVGDTFVAAQPSVAICTEHVSEGHLHSAQSLADQLRDVLVCENCLYATTAESLSRRVGQGLWCEMTYLLGPLHASVLEERESGLVALDQIKQRRKQM